MSLCRRRGDAPSPLNGGNDIMGVTASVRFSACGMMRSWRLAAGVAFALGVASIMASTPSHAQGAYPNQIVRFVVPFSAGSVTDGLARLLADELSKIWQHQVIVENRPGIAGTGSVAKSAPDGYTLMLTSNGHTILAVVNKNLPFDPGKDFVGVTQVASVPQTLIIPPNLGVATVKDFIALAKQKPGQLNFASAGLASAAFLGAETFKEAAQIDLVHVPYKGSPEAVTSVMRGDSHLYYLTANLAVELGQAGKVKVMAVSSPKRVAALPDVPTVSESGLPGYTYDSWFGVMAPANTPPAVLKKASDDIGRVLKMPHIADRLSKQGVDIVASGPQAFDALIKRDVERNTALLRKAGVGAN